MCGNMPNALILDINNCVSDIFDISTSPSQG